jgi:hypothetical protein
MHRVLAQELQMIQQLSALELHRRDLVQMELLR